MVDAAIISSLWRWIVRDVAAGCPAGHLDSASVDIGKPLRQKMKHQVPRTARIVRRGERLPCALLTSRRALDKLYT